MSENQTWIKVKRGLLEPKHRELMGVRVWLYLYVLDVADWETGTIQGWKDADVAAELEIPKSTVRRWRQELEGAGYITCLTKRTSQSIIIHNYTNPRQYSGKVSNPYTENGVHAPEPAPEKPRETHKTPTIKRKDLADLRAHFSSVSGIKEPVWSNLDAKSRRKYGAWWNTPLKAMWINAGCDLEKTQRAIRETLQEVEFAIYAPVSIEKAYNKQLSKPERKELPNANQL